jgi:predicted nucleic acid-binding protein
MSSNPVQVVWARRPAKAVARLGGRELLILSMRELLAAAARDSLPLVALAAPAPAAIAGFARAARDAEAPLLLMRPSGADEKGPEEAREDGAFADAAFRAAGELRFLGPLALLKDPPRAGSAVPDPQRVQAEIDAGFTGVSLSAADTQQDARNAALTASAVCQMELGLEIVPLGGAKAAAELARQLRSRGAPPSAVRITGLEEEAEALAAELGGTALSSATESVAPDLARKGVRQLTASGPFLRALRRTAPPATWDALQAWADEKGATLEQSAAHHQRLLRGLDPAVQDRLEALCCYEALDLFRKAGVRGTSRRLIAAVAALHEGED